MQKPQLPTTTTMTAATYLACRRTLIVASLFRISRRQHDLRRASVAFSSSSMPINLMPLRSTLTGWPGCASYGFAGQFATSQPWIMGIMAPRNQSGAGITHIPAHDHSLRWRTTAGRRASWCSVGVMARNRTSSRTNRAGVVPSGLCACKQAPSFVRAVTALPSCASCVTMLPSAEISRNSQAMSSSRSEQSAPRATCGAPTFRLAQ